MDSVREWEMQFKGEPNLSRSNKWKFFNFWIFILEKYEYVGRLLRPGEEPNSYSDEEDDGTSDSSKKTESATEKSKDDWPIRWKYIIPSTRFIFKTPIIMKL